MTTAEMDFVAGCYRKAEKRPSNEFDDTTGATPEIGAGRSKRTRGDGGRCSCGELRFYKTIRMLRLGFRKRDTLHMIHYGRHAAIALTVITSGLASTAPAFSDVTDLDRKICADRNEDADKKIAACTVVLGYPSEHALHANAFHQRGMSFFRKQKLDWAIADYGEAIKLDPKFILAYGARALAYAQKGDLDRALEDANEGLKLDPRSFEMRMLRGFSYRKAKSWDMAVADFSEAIKLKPNVHSGYLSRADTYRDKGDIASALADYDAAIQRSPGNVEPYRHRAALFFDRNETDKALADFDVVIRMDPKDPTAYAARSYLYKQSGDAARAAADIEQARKLGWKK